MLRPRQLEARLTAIATRARRLSKATQRLIPDAAPPHAVANVLDGSRASGEHKRVMAKLARVRRTEAPRS